MMRIRIDETFASFDGKYMTFYLKGNIPTGDTAVFLSRNAIQGCSL